MKNAFSNLQEDVGDGREKTTRTLSKMAKNLASRKSCRITHRSERRTARIPELNAFSNLQEDAGDGREKTARNSSKMEKNLASRKSCRITHRSSHGREN